MCFCRAKGVIDFIRLFKGRRAPGARSAEPGRRLAVNLRGVEKSDIVRGDVLGLPDVWHPTILLDAWLRYLPSAHLPLEHNDPVKLFVGAAEVMGHVRVLDRERILQLRRLRVDFGSHGISHAKLAEVPPEQVSREVTDSRRQLEQLLAAAGARPR